MNEVYMNETLFMNESLRKKIRVVRAFSGLMNERRESHRRVIS